MGVLFLGFSLYRYVEGGVRGECRNIVLYVVSFNQYLEQQFQASLVVWRYVSMGANLKWNNFDIVLNEVGIFFDFSCVGVQNIEWEKLKNEKLVC